MRVLVTGGAGFIGSHVVDNLLKKGISVTVIDNFSTGRPQNIEHVMSDITVVEADIAEEGPWQNVFSDADKVIHLAALADIVPSIEDPTSYYKSNVTGTLNVLQACKVSNIERLTYSASSSCYGIANQLPTPEDSPLLPEYPYALTKLMGEQLVRHWTKVYGISSSSLRFFNVYGTRSRTSGTYGAMFGVFLAQKLKGVPFTVVGNGEQTRDFTYVTDVADAVVKTTLSKNGDGIFNVGSGKTVSVNYVTQLLGGDVVYIPKRPGEPRSTHADISRIKNILGWEPRVGIKEGVEKVISEIDYWKDATVWTPEAISKSTETWFKVLKKYD